MSRVAGPSGDGPASGSQGEHNGYLCNFLVDGVFSLALLVQGIPLRNFSALLRSSAPARLICYVLGIVVLAVFAKILTQLLVPAAPSRWHALIVIKNLLLPVAMFAVYARLVRLLENRAARCVLPRNL